MVPYSTSSLGKESGTGLSNELPLYLLVIFVTFSAAVISSACSTIYIYELFYTFFIYIIAIVRSLVPYSSLGKVSGTGLSNELPLYLLVIFVTFSPAVIYISVSYTHLTLPTTCGV